MQPAMTPAMPQATATVMVPLAPAASASKKRLGVMRLSLSNRLATTATMMAMEALTWMVFEFEVTR